MWCIVEPTAHAMMSVFFFSLHGVACISEDGVATLAQGAEGRGTRFRQNVKHGDAQSLKIRLRSKRKLGLVHAGKTTGSRKH